MKLIDLKPCFLRHEFRFTDGVNQNFHRRVKTLQEAQGISFLCPGCLQRHGNRSMHRIVCWSRTAGASEHVSLGPHRWRLLGTGFRDLTLESEPAKGWAIIAQGCIWHGYVTNGDILQRNAEVLCSELLADPFA